MKWMDLNELRESYLKFFESKGHLRAKSFPLIPKNDNSLLLINAGMAPLKPYFTGQEEPPRRRMTTCQKCIRTGDIENVGITARHGTFFEMLGNFSFGDYFKEDAIAWAWEFVTKVLEIPEERLYVSVYEEDKETADIWHEKVGLPRDKIVFMGKEDNFWEAGIDGPCGPCSEIYFDRGEEYGCGKPGCTVGCDCDRYMEFWNLVFTQFERHEDGTYTPLAQKNIDTGMGLERLAAMMQGVRSIFDVDTIKAIRDHVCTLAHAEYGVEYKKDVSIRVITDHIRSVVFMASDGVLPSNEGRGYVMRRLLRRAVRHAKLLGIEGLFLDKLVKTVVDNSKHEYTELEEKYDYIISLLTAEESKFNATIDRGMAILNKHVEQLKDEGKTVLDGESCFILSDTHGFPLDLTKEILMENGLSCDEEGYNAAMQKQRETARGAHADTKYMGADETVFHKMDKAFKTEFVGYNTLEADSEISFIATDDELIENAGCGDEVYIVSPSTPFYAETGGQVGDTGIITTHSGKCRVLDTQKAVAGKFAHRVKVIEGAIQTGQKAHFTVDKERRESIMRNHTAAHLLQAALRQVLGEHVHQAGQLVDADRVRFDFSHFSAVSTEELNKVEALVNQEILSAVPITVNEMPIEEAKKLGAMALFGEKYGSVVRVCSVPGFSTEFCGGTHVNNTARLGLFKIVSETSVAAGIRRIEGVTGTGVLELIRANTELLLKAAEAMKLQNIHEVPQKAEALVSELKAKEKELEEMGQSMAEFKAAGLFDSATEVCGLRFMSIVLSGTKVDALKTIADKIKDKEPKAVCVIAGSNDGKTTCIAACGKEAISKGMHAGRIVKEITALTGGSGGGRPELAMGGVGDMFKLDEAMVQVPSIIEKYIKK